VGVTEVPCEAQQQARARRCMNGFKAAQNFEANAVEWRGWRGGGRADSAERRQATRYAVGLLERPSLCLVAPRGWSNLEYVNRCFGVLAGSSRCAAGGAQAPRISQSGALAGVGRGSIRAPIRPSEAPPPGRALILLVRHEG
jgi:hypothetical protein